MRELTLDCGECRVYVCLLELRARVCARALPSEKEGNQLIQSDWLLSLFEDTDTFQIQTVSLYWRGCGEGEALGV